MNWKTRLEKMSEDRVTKKVFEGQVEGERPRGRPQLRWTDNLPNKLSNISDILCS